MTLFHVIGLVVTCLLALAVIAFGCLFLYVNCLHGRFGCIPFRKTERRLSIVAWHNTRLTGWGKETDTTFAFDDWPIRQRPFYLSYQYGKRRVFMMFGVMEDRRWNAGRGDHPEMLDEPDKSS